MNSDLNERADGVAGNCSAGAGVALANRERTMSASDVIARLRALRANALNGDWFEEGHGIIAPDEATIVGSPWVAANVHWSSRPAIVAAMNSLPALLDAASQLEKLTEAASCIRHWHDAMADGSGMVVSAEHVRKLWDATEQARAALQALAEGGGE